MRLKVPSLIETSQDVVPIFSMFHGFVHIHLVEEGGQGGRKMVLGIPWWVLFCIVSIFFSGYMGFRALLAERELEQQFIEREGNIYVERMEAERALKQRERGQQSSEE